MTAMAACESTPLLSPPSASTSTFTSTPRSHLPPQAPHSVQIFGLIHKIRSDIVLLVDAPLSDKQLGGVKITTDVVEPLEKCYLEMENEATVYALLVNRVHFLSYQRNPSGNSVNHARANVCEILATRILRASFQPISGPASVKSIINTPPDDDDTTYRLAKVLCANFSPFQGAPQHVLEKVADRGNKRIVPTGNALEMAIISEAKQFIRSAACQKTVEDMWTGRVRYTPFSFYDFLPDHYKRREITVYRPAQSGVLDQYRLLVPKYRARLEYAHFLILFVSYFLCIWTFDPSKRYMNGWEIWFLLFSFGFSLDKVATILEHGYTVYMHSLWNGLDAVFITLYLFYVVLRVYGLRKNNNFYRDQAFDVLKSAAVVLFPRLTFVSLTDNVLVLSLRALMSSFVFLMFLATWCFAGFATAFYLLGNGEYSLGYITKLMLWIWFGLDGTGIHISIKFHPIIGPFLWVAYACLSSTLLLTIMVSMLSHIFSEVNQDALAEDMYRRAVNTFEGNKSDAIFLFQPPFNILALCILWPASFICNPRWYHKITVFFARSFNAPLLLSLTCYNRFTSRGAVFRAPSTIDNVKDENGMLPKGLLSFISAHRDIETTFEVELRVQEWEDLFKNLYPPKKGRIEDSDVTINAIEAMQESLKMNREDVVNLDSTRGRTPFQATSLLSQQSYRHHLPGVYWEGKRRGQSMEEKNRHVLLLENVMRREFDGRLRELEESNKRVEETTKKIEESLAKLMVFA